MFPMVEHASKTDCEYVDCQVHTHFSDGQYSPARLITMALDAGVTLLALTDHDTYDGWSKANRKSLEEQVTGDIAWHDDGTFAVERDEKAVTVLQGIEFSTQYNGMKIDILAFPLREEMMANFTNWFNYLRYCKKTKMKKMIDRLNRSPGVINGERFDYSGITYERVEELASPGPVDKPSFEELIIQEFNLEGVDINSSNETHLTAPGICSRDQYDRGLPNELDTEKLITLVKRCGAIPVWAHPREILIRPTMEHFMEVTNGSMGIELSYKKGLEATHDLVNAYAKSTGCFVSYGSDFHGRVGDNQTLGVRAPKGYTQILYDHLQRIYREQENA